MTTTTLTYTNPRLHAVIPDWPSGTHRTTATFTVEVHPTRGQRVTRTTIHPKTGKSSAPKVLTYARRMRIVDGSDGKTYVLEDNWTHLTVMQSNMKFQQEVIYSDDARYDALMALFSDKNGAQGL